MKTAVVILNWNTEGFLREFLPPLLHSVSKSADAEVVVADNASSDGSQELMKKDFPAVKTLVFEKNLGFTGGYNRAFRELRSERPEYFVLINSDIEVTEGWLQPLVDWMDTHIEYGACAPKLHSYQERDKFEYAGAAGGYLDKYGFPFCRGRVMQCLETDRGQYDEAADVLWATGACLMVRSSVYEQLNGLDDRFFAHMEEIDLCWRMQLAGYKVGVVPSSLVYHVGGGTLTPSSPFKLKLNYRNNQLMLAKNLAQTYALKEYKQGLGLEKAAEKGCRKAGRRIFVRQCLDWISALVYLCSGKSEYFNSVKEAYREYSKLKTTAITGDQLVEYLKIYGKKASVTGIYRKWMILEYLLKNDKVFAQIISVNFYKILYN